MPIEFINNVLFGDSKLVSYYQLESTADSKGSNTLTNNGSTSFNAAKFNNGADFGSSNTTKWLSVANDLGIKSNINVTLAGWVNITTAPATNTRMCIFSLASFSVADRGFALFYKDNAGTKQLSIWAGGNNTLDFTTTLTTGTWYHVAIVRDSVGGICYLYLNGELVASTTVGGTGLGGFNNFIIGADESNANKLSGVVDDVAVFNRLLFKYEIKLIYFAHSTLKGISTITGLSTITF